MGGNLTMRSVHLSRLVARRLIASYCGLAMNDTTDQSAADRPVNATRVARRALVLAAVVCRGSIERDAGQPGAESVRNRVLDWLTALNLWDEVEPWEEKVLRAGMGTLEAKEVIGSTWYAEGLAVLAWTLNRLDLPRHDEKVDPYAVADSLWFLSEDAAEVIRTATLRSEVELKACRELLYAIHCRLRDFARHKTQQSFTGWVEQAWIATLKLDAAQLIVRGDLALKGKPITEVKEDCLQESEWITRERHRAIIWLYEGYATYSQTPVDT